MLPNYDLIEISVIVDVWCCCFPLLILSCNLFLANVCQHKNAQVGFLKKPSLAVYQFPIFRQPDVHNSEERYLELLGSFNGVTETYHLTSLTVSPGVTEPYHLTLLDSFTWRYWTVSPDVTGQFHLALLKPITWRYSEYRTAIELFNMQQPTL